MSAPEIRFHAPPGPPAPYSEAVRAGDLIFLTGQLGLDASGALVPGGVGPETRQALENVKAILARCGSSLDRVVKVTVMLDDIADRAAMNEEYVKFFTNTKPARSALGGCKLVFGARVEIECVAVAG